MRKSYTYRRRRPPHPVISLSMDPHRNKKLDLSFLLNGPPSNPSSPVHNDSEVNRQNLDYVVERIALSSAAARPPGPGSSSSPKSKNKRFACDQCGHAFAQGADLRKHIRTVHEKQRPFSCDLCDKKFGEKGNLRKHRRSVHLNERPFSCAQCGSSFAFKDGLARHTKLVHDQVHPFTCARCGISYKQISQLRRHAISCATMDPPKSLPKRPPSSGGPSSHGPAYE